MLRDFVEKLKSNATSGSPYAEPTSGESSSAPSPAPAPAPPAPSQPAAPIAQKPSGHSVLGPDVIVKGSIRFSNELVIDGQVDGDVSSDGILTVGAHAVVKGEIKTRSVIVFGHMEGNVTTQDRCELKSTATLIGDISAGTLTIEEGASFIGQSRIGKRQGAIKKAPEPAAKPLEILPGAPSAETPAAVTPTRQAA